MNQSIQTVTQMVEENTNRTYELKMTSLTDYKDKRRKFWMMVQIIYFVSSMHVQII